MTSPDRYCRQTALAVIGPEGQARVDASTVLIVGCGALGSAQAELLARAGVGRLVIVDRDVVELHNLQRQLLFDERDAGERAPKAVAAARRLRAINSDIEVEAVVADVTSINVERLVRAASVVLDGTDNFETRYLLNDACVKLGRPWVYGGVVGADGVVMAVRPGKGPCLRCLFPEPPEAAAAFTCEVSGVLGTAVAWVAAVQATEALRLIVGAPAATATFRSLDVWDGSINGVEVLRDVSCPCCGLGRYEFLDGARGQTSAVLCGRNAVQISPERPVALDLADLAGRLATTAGVAATTSGLVLEIAVDANRLIVFPDGRVLVMGTTDPTVARGLVARFVGC
jgi:adenylyltransferase/sulfurtransferase